ncbi:hypothetical protein Liucustia_53 [Acinetobacter phage Liucustia]|nr:hypothetical protein Liucustia_53 [Acinetobacter phage Liucustia]
MAKPLDIKIGDVFGRLTVTSLPQSVYNNSGRPLRYVDCLCDCGGEVTVQVSKLSTGRTKSCGCLAIEMTIKRQSLPEGVAAFNNLIATYRKSAKDRSHDFKLSDSEFKDLISGDCFYCNTPPEQYQRKFPELLYNGIDRVENDIGYVYSNCVSCCSICNRMKGALPQKDFLDHINKIWTRTA